MQTLTHDDSAPQLDWQRVRPVLDDVLSELSERDREAVLLRFFEARDYATVGAKLQLADNAARMRVERALEKLRALLARRGVRSTGTALAAALAQQGVAAAPAGLALAVTGAALAGGGTAAGVAAAGTFMSMTKLQVGLASAVVALGGTGYLIQADAQASLRREVAEVQQHNAEVVAIKVQNAALRRNAAEVVDMRGDDAELARLQAETLKVRGRMDEVARSEKARRVTRATSAEPFDLSMLEQQPSVRLQTKPQYPFEMRRAGKGGEVVVEFVIDAAGDVQNARPVRSTQRDFENAAVQAVEKWKFRPGKKAGENVATRMQVPIVFAPESGTGAAGGMSVLETK